MGRESHEARRRAHVNDHDVLIRNADEAERPWFDGGGLHRWLVREGEVGDGFRRSKRPSTGKAHPAAHPSAADETFYLLDGSMPLHIDGVEHEVRAGGVAVIPRGAPHAFLAQGEAVDAAPPDAWGR